MIEKYFSNETPINCNYQEPFTIFSSWMDEAKKNNQIIEPTAMCLATCINDVVSSRMVLLKKFDNAGFCFFTNFNSHKGSQILT
ncbi:MAG: pyridoxamine 5'-phosphate oxidase family protein, partial [Alphaproteobacteria bacterium]